MVRMWTVYEVMCCSELNRIPGAVLQRTADVPFSLPGPTGKARCDLHRLRGRQVGAGWSHPLGSGQSFVQFCHRGRGRVDETRYALLWEGSVCFILVLLTWTQWENSSLCSIAICCLLFSCFRTYSIVIQFWFLQNELELEKEKGGIASIRGNLFGSQGITILSSAAQLYLVDGLVVFVLSWKVIIIISFNGEALKVGISFQNYWRFPFFHGDVSSNFMLSRFM